MKERQDVKGLIKELDSKHLDIRIEAAKALGDIGGFKAIDPLKAVLLRNNDPHEVIDAAAKALRFLRWIPKQNDDINLRLQFWAANLDTQDAAKEVASISSFPGIDYFFVIFVIVLNLKIHIDNCNFLSEVMRKNRAQNYPSQFADYTYYRTDQYWIDLMIKYSSNEGQIKYSISALGYIGDSKLIPIIEAAIKRIEPFSASTQVYNLDVNAADSANRYAEFAIDDINKKTKRSSLEISQLNILMILITSSEMNVIL